MNQSYWRMADYKDLASSVWLLSKNKDQFEYHGCEFKVRPATITVGLFLVMYDHTSTVIKQVVVLLSKVKSGAKYLRIYTESN